MSVGIMWDKAKNTAQGHENETLLAA